MILNRSVKGVVLVCCLSIMAVMAACGGGGESGDSNDDRPQMVDRRSAHTATMLSDGRLLVVGGRNDLITYTSAEIYDPISSDKNPHGSWSPAGDMQERRYDHVAISLQNGLVLAAGGDLMETGGTYQKVESSAAVSSAELFDPNSGTWTSVGPMLHPHGLGLTGTLLQNGKVLITGGLAPSATEGAPREGSKRSEIYDPATNTWTATGDLTEGRAKHQAVLLKTGKVLVIGGNSAELYDPATGKWSAVAQIPNNHGVQFSATLLSDGRILVAGGGLVTTVEGIETRPPSPVDTVNIFDPATSKWIESGPMVSPELGHTSTLLTDGTVLLVGPVSAQLYDATNDSWTVAGDMSTQRGAPFIGGPAGSSHTATLLNNGKVAVIGGEELELNKFGATVNREAIGSFEIYNPGSGWE